MAFGIGELLEGALDLGQADLAGDQRIGLDLPLGQQT